MKVVCDCSHAFNLNDVQVGDTVQCPSCEREFVVRRDQTDGPDQRAVSDSQTPFSTSARGNFVDSYLSREDHRSAESSQPSDPPGEVNPFTAPLQDTFVPDPDAPAESVPYSTAPDEENDEAAYIRTQFVNHESSIRQLGLLYYVGVLFLLPVGVFAFNMVPKSWMDPALVPFICLFYLGHNIILGFGLRRLYNWARIGTGLFAIPGLALVPFGTLIAMAIIYLMFSKRGAYVCSREYKEIIEATPHIQEQTSAWAVAMTVVAIALLVILAMWAVLFN